MAEQLQALLDRINEQGIEKAEAEKNGIIAAARKEAAKLVSEAKAESQSLIEEGRREAELLVKKGEEALKQASRNVLLSLREELGSRMSAVARDCLAAELSGPKLGKAIETAITSYMSAGGRVESLEILVPEAEREAVAKHMLAALGKDLKARPEVLPSSAVAAGFRLVFDGSDVQYDFSDEALLEVVCSFVNPKLAGLVKAG